jgi:hypothetical protein
MNNIDSTETARADHHQYTEAEILERRPEWADLEKSDISVGEAEDYFESNALWVSEFEIDKESHSIGINRLDIFGNGETSAGETVISMSTHGGDLTINDPTTARDIAESLLAAADELEAQRMQAAGRRIFDVTSFGLNPDLDRFIIKRWEDGVFVGYRSTPARDGLKVGDTWEGERDRKRGKVDSPAEFAFECVAEVEFLSSRIDPGCSRIYRFAEVK